MPKDLQIMANDCALKADCKFVVGMEQLAQRFMMELLMRRGSMKYLPDRGCNFVPRLRQAQTEFDVLLTFAAAAHIVGRNLRRDETARTPLQERYAGVKIVNIVIDDGMLHLDLAIRNQAKQIMRIKTPLIKM